MGKLLAHSRLPLALPEQLTLLGFLLGPDVGNQCTVLGLAFARSASLSHRPRPRCGTGIGPTEILPPVGAI